MQSHSSRHHASEALCDRHPYRQEPFETKPRHDEIAEAFGDRQIPKLVGVLQLNEEQLPEPERLHSLKLFSQLLSTQETKVNAINAEALQPLLTWLAHPNSSSVVRQLCCRSISSICQLQQGRTALVAADGLPVLTEALKTTPEAAVQAVQVFAGCADGAMHLQNSPAQVISALVKLIDHPGSSYTAAAAAAACITGLCKCDEGLIQALGCEAPRSLGAVCRRALGHSSAIASGNSELLGVLQAAAEALLVISHHPDGKTQLRQADCIPVLSDFLDVADDSVVGSAAACLALLTIEVESKVPVMSAAGGQLIRCAREGKPVIAVAAQTALQSAVEHLDARRKLENLLTGAEVKELLGVLPAVPPDYKCVVWAAEPEGGMGTVSGIWRDA